MEQFLPQIMHVSSDTTCKDTLNCPNTIILRKIKNSIQSECSSEISTFQRDASEMNKEKKRFNRRARQIVEVTTDDSFKNKVRVEVSHGDNQSYDEANPLVLPSKKRKTVIKKHDVQTIKLLSKKQRKRYEKIIGKKKKKEERGALLEALSKVQATAEHLSKLTSITELQTKGRKRMYDDIVDVSNNTVLSVGNVRKLNALKGNKKTKIARSLKSTDPNILGLESSSSESETSTEENDESPKLEGQKDEILQVELSSLKNPEEIKIDFNEPVNDQEEKQLKISDVEPKCNEKKKENTSESIIKKIFVPVDRDPAIQRLRLKLPIIGEEQVIMEAIDKHDVVIIAGETGSGKTTQLPQFLYEAGYTLNGKLIGVTEPRRVAAISMSRRVAQELNLSSEEVSYLIRFEGNTTPKTQIKFMTDGVLLKEIQKDFLLSKYSVIILDEAHERSVFTDILIGLLSRITPLRKKRNIPLKLIIMSATLRLTDFTENLKLFKVPPRVIKVDSRQYPVTVHFNKRTAVDYLKEAFSKACKIHTQLPEGGILIFLTGQQEVNMLVKKLRKTFPLEKNCSKLNANSVRDGIKTVDEIKKEKDGDSVSYKKEIFEASNDSNSDDDLMSGKRLRHKLRKLRKNILPEINLDDYATKPTEDEMELYETDDELDDDFMNESLFESKKCQPMWVLPLYSLLPSKKQAKVFDSPPEGCRLCVVATNVAETSLTIPHIKYVIDCGRTKIRLYDKLTGVSAFTVTWTSKASADQRAGRAGRTSAGHCYRLYSSAVFKDEFIDWSVPEIQRKPVDDLLLQMKALRIDRVVNFPFPSPPDTVQLRTAEKRLTLLGALKPSVHIRDEWGSKLTPLGESMAAFPVAPRFAKMLCLSQQRNLLPYTVAIVAALSVQEFLLMSNDNFSKIWRTWAGTGNSLLLGDVMVLLRALGAAEHASTTKESVEQFCNRCGLRFKAVVEARKLRVQLTNELNFSVPNLNLAVDPKMLPPTDIQARQLRQIMMAGMVDQVAYKLSDNELKQAGLSVHKAAYRMPELDDIIYLHSSSVLRKLKPSWIVYQELYQHNEKIYARGVTAIEPEWLPLYAAPLCNISEPLKEPPPYYEPISGRVMCSISSTYGRSGWVLPIVEVEFPVGEDKFRWLAQFFLEGLVCPQLKEYVEHLLSPPNTVFKTWAKFLMNRTNVLMGALLSKEVDTKDKLLDQWKLDSKYLLDAYLEWLPQSAHAEIRSLWPPM